MNVKIGVAPDSWGISFPSDPKQMPWQRFLDEVTESGYEWIELGPYGYLPSDPSTLRLELDKRGLKVAANWAMAHLEEPSAWPELERQVLGTGEQLAALGGQFLLLIDGTYTDLLTAERIRSAQLDESAWKRLIETTHKVADVARDRFGLRLVFHPHVDTHVEHEEQIEALLEQTDPERVWLCLDTGHHAYGGSDPIPFMRRHHHRIPHLHLKNIDPDVHRKVAEEKIQLATAIEMSVFCEPCKGKVDFLAFRDVLREIDYEGWATVEQDMYPAPFDKPLPIAKRTRDYLREIGIG